MDRLNPLNDYLFKSFILQDFADEEADLVYRLKINGREVNRPGHAPDEAGR